MPVRRRTSLLLSSAVCGALALTALGSGASASSLASVPPGAVTAPAAAPVPAPDALRKAAADGIKAIDANAYAKAAADAVRNCAVREPVAEQGLACTSVKDHLDGLSKARAGLELQVTAPAPDLAAITTATMNAVAATAGLAKDGVKPVLKSELKSDLNPGAADGVNSRAVQSPRDAASDLLSVVTGLVSGLVSALSGLVSGLTELVSGLLKALLGG